MEENVNRTHINSLVEFLQQDPLPKFTNGPKVAQFEKEWGNWQGSHFNTMVGSGSMANEISLLILKHLYPDGGDILLTPIGWISDVAAILQAGFNPVFVDIDPQTFSVDKEDLRKKITKQTRGLLLVHVLGIVGFKDDDIINICKENNLILIEDCCESHGATYKNSKIGSFGEINNFSFFYAHHLCSLSEGGMIGTNNNEIYQLSRIFRSHGMVRESTDIEFKNKIALENPSVHPDFIFLDAAHNGRSQECNAVVASSALPDLTDNCRKRAENLNYFIGNLDSNKYRTNINLEGNSAYALLVVLKNPSFASRNLVEEKLKGYSVEFRRGLSGGGSALRQNYLKRKLGDISKQFPQSEYVSDFGFYIGNYPNLPKYKIDNLLRILNSTNI